MEKADLLEAVAWEFFDEHSHGYGDERNFTLKEVSDFLDRCTLVLQKGPGARDDIIFRTLLRLRDSDTLATNGAISFQHKSFQEFFVARRIYSRMLRGSIDDLVETFGRLFSPEVSEFLKEFLVEVNGSPKLQQSSYERLSAAFASATTEGGPHDRIRIARQQLGYYLGNVRYARAHQWLKDALASESDPWVRRGIAVGLAFGGDLDALDEYVDALRSELDGDDRRENAVNLGFHLTFFGDQPVDVKSPETDQGGESCAKTVEGLVYQLGTETDRPSWRLNLYTLWYLVTQARVELRESAGQRLRDLGGTAPELVQQLLRDPAASQWPETQAVGNLVTRLSR